jgi:hypothetical protein
VVFVRNSPNNLESSGKSCNFAGWKRINRIGMEMISPKYKMNLVEQIEKAIWQEFSSYEKVMIYIRQWQYLYNERGDNFKIIYKDREYNQINLLQTLHIVDDETLIKIAIDMGIDTPDFIPSIPVFRNELKAECPVASAVFEKAFRCIENDPALAIGLANSALESIVKEVLKSPLFADKKYSKETLYTLTQSLLKEFKLMPNSDMPNELKTLGSSLLSIAQSIESLRSEQTPFHGKSSDDIVVSDPMYAYLIVNSVTTVGLFLQSYYKKFYADSYVEDLPC